MATKEYNDRLFIVIGSFYNYMPVGANYLAQSLFENECPVIFLEQPTSLFLIKNPWYVFKVIKDIFIINFKKDKINVITLASKILPLRIKEQLIQKGFGFMYAFQDSLLNCQTTKIKHNIKNVFKNIQVYIIFNDPFSYKVARNFKSGTIIFRVCDKYEKYPGWENQSIVVKKILDEAIVGSDFLLATSDYLYKDLLSYGKKTYLFPNGYQPIYAETSVVPKELKNIKKPIIGFVGSVNSWIDVKLIKQIAFKKPDYSLVIIGPIVNKNYKMISNLKNVYLLGYKPRSSLGNYYKAFDVAIAPFILNELSESINPIKFYEYLVFGLPVVSTPIREIKNFSGLIYMADSSESFIFKIEQALKENSIELQEKRKKFALDNSWSARIYYLLNILNKNE